MTARGQNSNNEDTSFYEFDYCSDENDVVLDRGDLQGDTRDIGSSNELDPNQSNSDDSLDLNLGINLDPDLGEGDPF